MALQTTAMAWGVTLLVVMLLLGASGAESDGSRQCKAWLVQSIPTDMPELPLVPGVLQTGDVLRWLAGNATRSLDIVAQYWQLLAQPHIPESGEYGFTQSEMEHFGAPIGQSVFNSLEAAADRKIPIRIVQHSGFSPDYDTESAQLASGRPNVHNRTLLLDDWFGAGIVHTKLWIADKRHVYIGSANNDWKSLTQVKELGIYIANCSELASRAEIYFHNLWTLTSLNASMFTKTVFDKQWQVSRKLPCWSRILSSKKRCKSPLADSSSDPEGLFHLKLDTPGYSVHTSSSWLSYLSFAPQEIMYGHLNDEQGWIDTILSTPNSGTLRISTMDWLGQSQYTKYLVYWPALSSAISSVVFSKHATVYLLVARWTHFIDGTDEYLRFLDYANTLCSASKYNKCSGKVEIKYYEVPGFNSTGPAVKSNSSTQNLYPGFTRVNHGKYAVSSTRAHIGTSNLIWDYFYTTTGLSFGSYNPNIVEQLQVVFDADWNSPYAVPLSSSHMSS